jgi:ribosomal protein L30/L7E
LPLLFSYISEYAIRKFQENQVGLKLNRTHQLLVYADDINLLRGNIDVIKKYTETVIDSSEEIGQAVNAQETSVCCCLVTRMKGKIMT